MKKSIFAVVAVAGLAASASAQTIADARAAGNNAQVDLNEVIIVNTTDTIASGNSRALQLRDNTGAITVFGSNANVEDFLGGRGVGDTVSISNMTTGSFNGLFQLQANTAGWEVETTSNTLGLDTEPVIAGIEDFQDMAPNAEGFESDLVRLNGVQFVNAGDTFQGVQNYTVTDGDFEVTVRIPTNDNDLIGTTIPSGTWDLVGVFSQFDNSNPGPGEPGSGYQLLIRGSADVIPAPGAMALLAMGGLLAIRRRRA